MKGQSVEARAFARRWAKARQGAMPLPAWLAVCTLIAAMFVFPLAMVALTVLKTPQEASASPPMYFPRQLSLQNFENLSRTGAGLLTYIGNSAGVASGTTLATVLLSTLAGYGFGRFAFAGRTVLFIAVLATMMIPFQAILTPLYVVLFHLGLLDTRFGVMLVYTTFQMPFSVFLMRNAFMQIPRELEEAAVVDGSGTLRTLFNVMIPLVSPGIATVALFAFFTSWNEFQRPLSCFQATRSTPFRCFCRI